jgi:hypothetical protein
MAGTRRSLAARLTRVDRRILFLAVALAVAFPLLHPLNLPIRVSREARAFYDEVERVEPGRVILLSFDYEPDTMAELDPMSLAVLRHAFRRGVRVLVMTTYAGGVGIAERILAQAAGEAGKTDGTDYAFLGYNPDFSATILRMGESIRGAYPTDQYGRPTAELPILRGVDSYADIPLVVTIASSALSEYWVIWAGGQYHARIVAGNTAIQAVLIYPFLQTGQLAGMLGGLKGAAEYERLIGRDGAGVRGMDGQSLAHFLIVLFIVMGNVGFLLARRARLAPEEGA